MVAAISSPISAKKTIDAAVQAEYEPPTTVPSQRSERWTDVVKKKKTKKVLVGYLLYNIFDSLLQPGI